MVLSARPKPGPRVGDSPAASGLLFAARLGLILAAAITGLLPAAAAPFLNSFSPSLGEPGVQVRITGFQLSAVNQVRFGGALADFSLVSPGELLAIVPNAGLTGPIQVSDPSGSDFSDQDFMVAPRITEIVPARASTNTAVVIKGANLGSTTNVFFGDVPAASFAIVANTQLRVTIPYGASSGPVLVATPAGVAVTNGFVVTGPGPIIDSFSPASASPGTPIRVNGVNFAAGMTVMAGTLKATNVDVSANTQLTAKFPEAEVIGKVTVSNSSGTNVSSSPIEFTWGPIITNFTPTVGVPSTTTSTGTRITVTGINFTSIVGVGIGDLAASYGGLAQNQLQVTVPKNALSGLISITNQVNGTKRVGRSSQPFIVTLAPIITNFSPTLGKASDAVTLFGMNMGDPSTALFFNGTQATFQITGMNGTQARATVPKGATSGPLTMTNTYGAFTTASNFYVFGSAPYVTDIVPNAGPRGTSVLISGRSFTAPATVRFGGVDATAAVTALSQIQATVPNGALSGPITVITPTGTNTNEVLFYAPPRLTAFQPTNGIEGTPVTLRGTNFLGATSVLFNDTPAPFAVAASNLITTTVPLDALSGPITVQAPGGDIVSMDRFVVLPQILGFTPTLGPVGTSVQITGTSFRDVNTVKFGGIKAAFTNDSPTLITASVPPGATTGPIEVATDDGVAVSPSAFEVTTASDLQLNLTALPPVLAPGEPVTFRLQMSNAGPSTLTGLMVTDALPDALPLVSADATEGAVTQEGNTVTWKLPVLTNATSATLAITAQTLRQGVFVNTAEATAAEGDIHPADNRASATVTVLTVASRTLSITRLPDDHTVLLSWPLSPVSFGLQAVDTLQATNLWNPVEPPPVEVDGWNLVTNVIDTPQRYFRLKQQ